MLRRLDAVAKTESMYNVEDAPPAGKSRDTFGQIAFVSESIIRRLSRFRGGLRS